MRTRVSLFMSRYEIPVLDCKTLVSGECIPSYLISYRFDNLNSYQVSQNNFNSHLYPFWCLKATPSVKFRLILSFFFPPSNPILDEFFYFIPQSLIWFMMDRWTDGWQKMEALDKEIIHQHFQQVNIWHIQLFNLHYASYFSWRE